MSFGEEDLGKYAIKGEKIYRIVAYQKHPMLFFENIETGEREYHSVESLNIQEFIKLVPEESK